jgi:prevent-host-death family protein
MTIHFTVTEADTRLAQLVDAAVRGEEVVLAKAGAPQVRLVPVEDDKQAVDRPELVERRLSAFGMYRDRVSDPDMLVGKLMTAEEQEESWRRKFGPAD